LLEVEDLIGFARGHRRWRADEVKHDRLDFEGEKWGRVPRKIHSCRQALRRCAARSISRARSRSTYGDVTTLAAQLALLRGFLRAALREDR
jgi:hypothetical protein